MDRPSNIIQRTSVDLPMPDMPQVLATEAFQQGITNCSAMALRQLIGILHCLS